MPIIIDPYSLAAAGITFVDSAVSSGTTITVPALAAAGDFAYLVDAAEDVSGLPTTVVPGGWTNIVNTPGANQIRVIHSRKVLAGGDLGAVVTGMNGDSTDQKIMLVFRTVFTIGSVTASTYNQEATPNDPSQQTVTASGQTPPLIVFCSAATDGGGGPAFNVESPALQSKITQGKLLVGYTIYNSSPANQSIDMADLGPENTLQSGYVRLAA